MTDKIETLNDSDLDAASGGYNIKLEKVQVTHLSVSNAAEGASGATATRGKVETTWKVEEGES